MRWVLAAAAALSISAVLGAAHAADPPAAPSGGDAGAGVKVTAEDLYQQGLDLAKQGKWAEAAARLEESNRLDPAPGTTINLADCYEHLGKLASAWTLFVEAASIFNRRTPPDPRGAMADTRASALQPRLSRLTIEVPPAVRAIPGLLVKRDGAPVGAGQLGTAIAVDPGTHVVEVSAPGKETWKTEVKVGAEAAKESVTVPALADAKGAGGGAGNGGSGLAKGGGAGGAGGAGDAGWPWQKKAAIGVGGAGVVGVVVGAIFGGDALGKHGELEKRCAPGVPRVCDTEGVRIGGELSTVANVSTVGFAVGGALIAAGVVLWVVAPSGEGGAKAGESGKSGRSAKPGASVWVAPVMGEHAGAMVGGSF